MLGTNANEGSIFTPMMLFIVKGIKFPLSDDDIVLILHHCLVSLIVCFLHSAGRFFFPLLSHCPLQNRFNQTELDILTPLIMVSSIVSFFSELQFVSSIVLPKLCSHITTIRRIRMSGTRAVL